MENKTQYKQIDTELYTYNNYVVYIPRIINEKPIPVASGARYLGLRLDCGWLQNVKGNDTY